MRHFVLLLSAGLLCFPVAQAYEAPATELESEAPVISEIPPGPCETEDYHQFDFWIGEWNVTDLSGNHQGNNRISVQENGCLILEEWTSVSGGTGQSYNYYDPATGLWRQLWVSSGAIIDYTGGLTETGSMKLEGVITYHANAKTAPFTGEWTPNADGSVTQHFEQYDAEKDAWTDWFTGIYRRMDNQPQRPLLRHDRGL